MFFRMWGHSRFGMRQLFPLTHSRKRSRRRLLGLESLEERRLLAATIFVATTGNDTSGTGSMAAPYATLARALTAAEGGDTVTLRGGTYTGGARIRVPGLTIQSQPGEWAIITAPINNANIDSAVRFEADASGGRLSRLEITGGYYYGVMLQTTWDWGPTVPKYGASNITITDCKIHDTGRDCIKLTPLCNDVTIQRSEIYNSGRRDASNAEGIDNVNANRLIVQDCYIHDIATNGLYAKGGATGCIIQRNVISNCGVGGIMVGFYTDAEYFSTGTNPGYYENIDGIVRNNIIMNTQMTGIGLYASLRAQVFNNTLVNVAQTAQAAVLFAAGEIYFDTNPVPLLVPNRGTSFQNNIVVQSAASSRDMFQIRSDGLAGAITANHNRYYHAGTTAVFEDDRDGSLFTGNLAQWRTHSAGESGSSEGNPQLDSNHHLAAGSPCIDAGITLGSVTEDIDREARTTLTDIGADEWAGQLAAGVLQFSAARYDVGESAGEAFVTVTRSGNTATVATVRYATSNGTATNGSDYRSTAGTLSFAVGESSATVRIPITNDTVHEANETVLLALGGPTGATLGSIGTAILTIVDNDPAPTLPAVSFALLSSRGSEATSPLFDVRLSAPSSQRVTVRYSLVAGTATPRSDYTPISGTLTFEPGQTVRRVRVPVMNDTLVEANETFSVRLASPVNATMGANITHAYTILDDDARRSVSFAVASSQGSEDASPQIAVRLSAASGRIVTVGYTAAGGSATAGVDFSLPAGSVTFQPGETVKFLPLVVVNDSQAEQSETIRVTLSSVTNARLGTDITHTYTILDNDQTVGAAIGHLTWRGADGHLYRVGVQEGVGPDGVVQEDLSARLNALSPGSNDRSLSISPDGKWMALETDRFGIGGWTGLALVRSDLSSGEAIRVGGNVIHPEGKVAVASGGNLIVYSAGDGPHTRDLWAIRRSGGAWSTPRLLTGASPYAFHSDPSIAADGTTVLFDAGHQPYAGAGTALAEVHTDGTAFRVVLTPAGSPAGLPKTGALHSPGYAPDGSIVFEADWNGERIWRLRKGETVPVQVGNFDNDNSPVVLPDGRIASLWLGRAGNIGNHELKIMSADGSRFFTLLTGQDIMDIGLGAGL